MALSSNPSQKLSELIDQIERIREELLAIQRSMEEMERPRPEARDGRTKAMGKRQAFAQK
jgi:hypothetical protein